MSEIALPRDKPTFEGFLEKRSACGSWIQSSAFLFPTPLPHRPPFFSVGEWLHQWRRRYFKLYVITGSPRLFFSTDKDTAPHGLIDLRHCITVKSADEKTGKRFSFEVTTAEQTFYMCAEADKAKDEWVGQLGRAIVLASTKAPPMAAAEEEEEEDDDD
jgi:hypothetical protein